ncbi:MAG: prenyltransferase, partial [Dehalococcoidia bacterium]|nr:prenyltransferase [Dehalococcoidia bacterium]
MASVKTWILETRPSFLLLVPVCVFAGVAVSIYEGYPFNAGYFVLAFIGALFAHISANVFNEYFDYKSGIDLNTQRTPFSGGSGILPAALLKPKQVLALAIGSLSVTIIIGIYFISIYGSIILAIGLLGIIVIVLYTPYLTKLTGITELAGPGLGFGLMVFGTYVTQTGAYSSAALIASVVAGLLIAGLLLLNEFPDVEADKGAGRKHIPIVLSKKKAAVIYCLMLVFAYALLIGAVAADVLPLLALLGLLTLPLGIKAI